ncbi:MAG: aa3-type cytochrome c oxidase subunit IV [Hyphomonadaceae bacterium]|nr:aa3-type cytochrome c oxidase subunit IV [Hyphomonadaceae bacterium]
MASHQDDHADHSDYARGHMDVSEQSTMYENFLVASQWGSVLIAAMVTCMTLIWASTLEWRLGGGHLWRLAIGAGAAMKIGRRFHINRSRFHHHWPDFRRDLYHHQHVLKSAVIVSAGGIWQ